MCVNLDRPKVLATKNFVPALAEFFGSEAGLSAAAITRLTGSWAAERDAFMSRDLSEVDYVYCWVDGVHFSVRLGDDDRLCVLVMVGVRIDGRSSSPSRTATGSPPSPGRSCCGTPSAGGCGHRCWPSVTGRSCSGPRSATCSR